jgi:MYXO-CTERM domain-containing protein
VVVWIAGEESTADEALSDAQQARLRDHWSGGGSLWVSGSEVLWDLDYLGSATDKAFAEEVLGATMAADDADTWTAEGVDLLAGLTLDFSEEGGAPYHNEYPDVLGSDRTVIAEYAPGQAAAILGERVAHFGFPVDCIGDESTREEVALRVLDALLPGWEAPDLTEPGDTGAPDSDPSDPDRPGGLPEDSGQLGPKGSPGESVELSKLGGCACSSTARERPSAAWFGLLLLGALRRRKTGPGSAGPQAGPITDA